MMEQQRHDHTLTDSRMPFTQSMLCIGSAQNGPPIRKFAPVSGHCWGTAGPTPGMYLTPLFFWIYTHSQSP